MAKRKRKGPGSRGGTIGRPRQNRPSKDLGTPEQQAKREMLVGKENQALASYPLGVLFARKIITQDQHDAGVYYAYLFGRMFGKIHPGPSSGAYNPFGNDEAQEIIEPLYRDAESIIHGISRATKDAVENCSVYGHLPSFLFKDNRPVDRKLLNGLSALAEWKIRGRLKVEPSSLSQTCAPECLNTRSMAKV